MCLWVWVWTSVQAQHAMRDRMAQRDQDSDALLVEALRQADAQAKEQVSPRPILLCTYNRRVSARIDRHRWRLVQFRKGRFCMHSKPPAS